MLDSVLAILAGGSSRRFQVKDSKWQDKALLEINRSPLLIHLLKQSKSYYSNICISVNSVDRKKNYSDIIKSHTISEIPPFIVDYTNTNFKGVFLGIYSVLSNFPNKSIQFIPSDRPFLDLLILSKLRTEKSSVSILQYEKGMIEPLLSLYGSDVYLPKEFEQLSLTRADVLIRLTPNLQVYNATSILEENNLPSYIFDNINVQEDYTKTKEKAHSIEDIQIPPPMKIKRSISSVTYSSPDVDDFLGNLIENENFYLAFLWSQFLVKRLSKPEINDIGVDCLKKEYRYWLENRIPFLALHALQDLIHFFPEERNMEITQRIAKLKTEIEIKSKKV